MSFFRSPLYLDTEIMVPLANYHDIEVMTDVSVSQRDRGERSGKMGAKLAVPVPGSPGFDIGGARGSESEVTQERVVRSHPANALNKLLDSLHGSGDLVTNLSTGSVFRHQIVEADGEWDVSPATDVGALLSTVMSAYVANPAAIDGSEPPPELMASLVGGQSSQGKVVLDAVPDQDDAPRLLVLLNSECLVGSATIDDLAEERTVFGQVDAFVPEGSAYPLQKYFLSGFNRSLRRAFPVDDLLSRSGEVLGRPVAASDLDIAGPVVVIKAIAIY